MSTIFHLLLALALTMFLAFQAGGVLFVLRSRHAEATPNRSRDAQTGGGAVVVE